MNALFVYPYCNLGGVATVKRAVKRKFRPRQIGKGRKKIHGGEDLVTHPIRRNLPWPTGDEGNSGAAVPG